jgi:hypothetical protein
MFGMQSRFVGGKIVRECSKTFGQAESVGKSYVQAGLSSIIAGSLTRYAV